MTGNRLVRRARTLIAAAVACTALIVPLSVVATPAGATSAYCTALFSWEKHQVDPPAKLTITSYRTWSKTLLPYYEKLAATAPNAATKTVLNDLVSVLKAYANNTSLKALSLYEVQHHAAFERDVTVLAQSIEHCATTIKLP